MAEDQEQELETDVLFAGATRPAMIFGASFDFAIINVFTAAMALIATGNPLYMLMALPIHAIGFIVCLNDPQFFSVMKCWIILISTCPNRWFWGKSTYNP
jgi:type IV secretion system protein VirB3